jgi:predicted acyltransferase (DUF342 family)
MSCRSVSLSYNLFTEHTYRVSSYGIAGVSFCRLKCSGSLQALDIVVRHSIAVIPNVVPRGTAAYLTGGLSFDSRLQHRVQLSRGTEVRHKALLDNSDAIVKPTAYLSFLFIYLFVVAAPSGVVWF